MIPVQVVDCWECPDNHLVLTLVLSCIVEIRQSHDTRGYNVLLEAAYNL